MGQLTVCQESLSSKTVSFYPLTSSRWPDLVALFGPRGACAGCWCMWWRMTTADFRRNAGEGNRAAFQRLVEHGPAPGILAYAKGRAVGWCAIAPREHYPRLARSRVLAAVDLQQVWSVSCLFVAREWRRTGLSTQLLGAAAKFAAQRGARIVEGYPHEVTGQIADAFVYTGLASAFRKAGFKEVARRSAKRPIMRKKVSRS